MSKIVTCDETFDTQQCYLNGNLISIDTYLDRFYKIIPNSKYELRCKNNHELIFADCEKMNKYFRHKNAEDCKGYDMTLWHRNWQESFDKKYREVHFKKGHLQHSDRRADICIGNIVVEFQHSKIANTEVDNRIADYKISDKHVVWVINGTGSIDISKEDGRHVLTFNKDTWKYQSFTGIASDSVIFIDIITGDGDNPDHLLYKVCVGQIRSNMICVRDPITKNKFIKYVNDNDPYIIKMTPNEYIPQCKLFVKQEGAGNGKTYGIVQQLVSKEFQKYNTIIMITKQHAAKTVIFEEFSNQKIDGKIEEIEVTSDIYDDIEKEFNSNVYNTEQKKYIIRYTNLVGKKCILIIATVDSFIYSIGDKDAPGVDKFEAIAKSISSKDFIEKNHIKFGGEQIKLDNRVCLICDETQDLLPEYGKAIIKIMLLKNIDAYVVGDNLQSLQYEKNAFNYLLTNREGFPHIEMPHLEPNSKLKAKNICRRFTDPRLRDFINDIIDFNKFNLPQIELAISKKIQDPPLCANIPAKKAEKLGLKDTGPIELLRLKITTTKSCDIKINKEVKKFMKLYREEVSIGKYINTKNGIERVEKEPNDFLIIAPTVKNNPLIEAIDTAIQNYWVKRSEERNKYRRYSVLHRSETGTSINTNESKDATRIVSIHTSKGDGRMIVFVIGLSESALHLFNRVTGSLQYESLLHVALTRVKHKMYISLTNNCDVYSRVVNSYNKLAELKPLDSSFLPDLHISNSINFSRIKSNLQEVSTYNFIKKLIIDKKTNLPELNDDDKKKAIIDMGHHNIRFFIMAELFSIESILYHNNSPTAKKQLAAKYYNVIYADIDKDTTKWSEYNKYLDLNVSPTRTKNDKQTICFMRMSKYGNDYIRYHEIMCKFADKVRSKIKRYLDNKTGNFPELCVYEYIILHYMNQCVNLGKYTEIHINDLYEITHVYATNYNINHNNENCLCKKHFGNAKVTPINKGDNMYDVYLYIKRHYTEIQKIKTQYDTFLNSVPRLNWLSSYPMKFQCQNDDYKLYQQYNFIGYDDNTVYIVYIKPDVNNLNYNEIILNSLFDSFAFDNFVWRDDDDNNDKNTRMQKFKEKTQKVVILSANHDYIIIDWKKQLKQYNNVMKQIFVNEIISYYKSYVSEIYSHFNNVFFEHFYKETNNYGLAIDQYIKKLKTAYKEADAPIAPFINDFIAIIDRKIRKFKDIEKFREKEYFIQEMNSEIITSICRFFDCTTEETHIFNTDAAKNINFIDRLTNEHFGFDIVDFITDIKLDKVSSTKYIIEV